MIERYIKLSVMGLLGLTGLLSSCSTDELELYDQKKGMLSFAPDESAIKTYSFMSRPEGVMRDTVWFTVNLIGFTSDRDRYYELEQIIPEPTKDTLPSTTPSTPPSVMAEAGKHFVPFDSPEVRQALRFPANAITAQVPVILLRDPSLKQEEVTLRFKLKESSDFNIGYKEYQHRTLKFSDKLVKPNLWVSYFLGTYGPVKHSFMIQATGENWDDDYLRKLGFLPGGYVEVARQAYVMNLVKKLYKKLAAENKARQARGEKVLSEADGSPVTFRVF